MSADELAKLAADLRAMASSARNHYSPTGVPLVAILMTPDWLERLRRAADVIEAPRGDA